MRLSTTVFSIPILVLCGLTTGHAQERWYTSDQAEHGRIVFDAHCAECHGAQAQGLAEDWAKAGPDGKYPPPPLNGTAHAWHHPRSVLRRTIREGGIKLGGQMPGFATKLKDNDIDAAIAYFQSFWSDEIYRRWLERSRQSGDDPGPPAARNSSSAAGEEVLARLAARIPGAALGIPESTPVAEWLRIKAGSRYLYLSRDGRYALVGDLIDLETGENLTESQRADDRLTLLEDFPRTDRVVFSAAGEQRAAISVFTDTSCPYCRKLHAEVPQLQAAGVSVNYIAFPRGGPQGPGYRDLRSVWCAADRTAAMDIVKGAKPGQIEARDCDAGNAVDAGYMLGQQVGVTGTPAIVLPDGTMKPGYVPAAQLLTDLRIRESE